VRGHTRLPSPANRSSDPASWSLAVFSFKPPWSELNFPSCCPLSRILPFGQIVLAIVEFRSQEGEMISAQAVPNLLELPRGTSGSSDLLFTRARYRDPGGQPHLACAHFTTTKNPCPACRCRVSSSSNLYYAGSPGQVRLSRVLGNLYPQEQRL
jgi:hypothetical protein